ncbi:gliding motility-associated C-terminal domain-containing protein [Flavivirga eckloniae]|uniref:Ig-like domain-containing protein n=1 Tax=Flavivirga eckloniae TaxID=1803846 RepID=A0A2K9PQ04_9FLAO|nr:gliding motility-associated C-terminal domain-containing protein [Flavivirga eckloniae]AUP78908.1 hypothetical protein C1H87_09425 [Flavivirga eckloniae]
MKLALVFRNVLKNAFYVLMLCCTSLSVFAQCPDIPVSPQTVCDASGLTVNDLNVYATNIVNGIAWYDVPTGGTPLSANQLVLDGATYYADDDSGSCGTRQSLTVNFDVAPTGRILHRIYCDNANATLQDYINEILVPSIPAGGSVEVYYPAVSPNPPVPITPTDPVAPGSTSLLVTFVDNLGCKSQFENGLTYLVPAPQDPTPASPQEFCANTNPTVGDLDRGTLATNFVWYQSIDIFGNPIPPALSLTTPLVDGNTYYIIIDDVLCDSNPIPVTVNIDIPLDAGTPGSRQFCEDDIPTTAPFNLFDELGGMPDVGGTWASPPSITTTNGHLGTVDISASIAGTYVFTYSLNNAPSACPPSTSTVTITISPRLSPGTPSPTATVLCVSDLSVNFDLTTLLNNDEDPGGQWTRGTLSTDPMVTSPIDLTAFIPGVYNFTYTQNRLTPCPEDSTTVQLEVVANPNAGTALNDSFCENALVANYNLFDALDGSQDNNGGTWTDATNNPVTTPIDITGFTVAGSPYTFNYTIDNGTCSDTEAITITIQQAPESGTPVATFSEFCEGTAPANYDLFDLLDGEDQAGTWYLGPDNLGAVAPNPTDLSSLTPGTYDFTYEVTPLVACSDVLVTVSVTINPLPNTGTPTPATYCENDLATASSLDLFDQLTGESLGGTWTDDDTSNALSGSNVDLTALIIGSFNYTYSITDANGCMNSSTVTITVEDAPESGTPIATLPEFCVVDITTNQAVDLFDLLTGEDPSGTWNDDDASLALSGSSVTIDGLMPGTYNFTYDVTAIGTCDDPNVTVSITINDTLVPTAAATQEFCDTATVADLTATGATIQWYNDATGGTPLAGTTALINGENYFATQTNATTGCESSTRTEVTVTIHQSPSAGALADPAISECNNTTINLFDGLDGSQDSGGTWYEGPNNSGTIVATPTAYDVTGLSANNYQFTYYVTASAPCIDDSITITVTIDEPLSAGTNNTLDACSTDGTTDLFTLLGAADPGGTWSPALTSGTGVFDPSVDPSATYRYTHTNACGTSSSEVVVTVTQAPNAGTDNAALICVIDGPTDLFTFLGGADAVGTWTPALASGTGVFDPLVDAQGVYTYTVTANAPCATDATADITVTVSDITPPVVNNATMEFCLVNNPTVADLDAALTVTGTITWYDDATLTTQLDLTDALVDGEDYHATQRNASGCESSISVQVDVVIHDTPTPTINDLSVEYCINDGPIINDLSLNITEYDSSANNIVWYDAATGGSAISSSTLLNHEATYYAALIDATTGCESSVRLPLTTDLTSCGKLILPDGFSPNGDGTNDTYDFDNLHILYPDFVIEIFNRYGNIVYKGNANTPRFDGTSNQSGTIGNGDLPVGVYYYVFIFNDGENKPEQGRLYLSR